MQIFEGWHKISVLDGFFFTNAIAIDITFFSVNSTKHFLFVFVFVER